jgi:hypothetical protein
VPPRSERLVPSRKLAAGLFIGRTTMFKKGDTIRVKLIQNSKNESIERVLGKEFEVYSMLDKYVYLVGMGGGWRPDRFELVRNAAHIDTVDAANYYHAIVGYSND